MKAFAALYSALDATTSTRDKQAALVAYFRAAPAADAAWAAYFLAGGKPRQTVPTRVLRESAQRAAGLPPWLFEESYLAVGDLAETIAHVLPPPQTAADAGLAVWIEARLLPLRGLSPEALEARLIQYWDELEWPGRFLLTKLIGGGFRVGVSRQSVVRALAEVANIDHKRIAHRMVGYTDSRRVPSAERFARLLAPLAAAAEGVPAGAGEFPPEDAVHAALPGLAEAAGEDAGLPYPFFLAHPLQTGPDTLGARENWLAEWKWDGIRAQLVKRGGHLSVWSRGEDLITERFPEIAALAACLPDGTVIDGEIIAWAPGAPAPMPFAGLQPRITRKTLSRKILQEAPAALIAYDLLEADGCDLRSRRQDERRARLEAVVGRCAQASLRLSALLEEPSWQALAALRTQSRARGVEGLMLKRRDSHYGVGRTKASGEWWKWKIDPYTVDAVLIYAQQGHGRRASLYTDYTFAVWDREAGPATASTAGEAGPAAAAVKAAKASEATEAIEAVAAGAALADPPEAASARMLVPFAKAYSGLSDEEIRRVDAIVRKTTLEKFGPVRSVTPSLVFEIAFEGIAASPRHKSGIAVRFPRILRWRLDKSIDDADSMATLRALLTLHEAAR